MHTFNKVVNSQDALAQATSALLIISFDMLLLFWSRPFVDSWRVSTCARVYTGMHMCLRMNEQAAERTSGQASGRVSGWSGGRSVGRLVGRAGRWVGWLAGG